MHGPAEAPLARRDDRLARGLAGERERRIVARGKRHLPERPHVVAIGVQLVACLRRAEALLRRAAHAPADGADGLLRCGDVALDPAGRTASRGGSPVDLTRTEFDVLELLLAHPGRVFTRDELLSLVWHYEFASDPKIVNIHVMNIRKKLGAGLVATVRGIGYKLGEA